jgi:CheY-like chemotaxis protein
MSRLLVVDDDPVVLNLVQIRLKTGGHRVISASDPDEALRVVEERGLPDVAVLDVSLPGMSGLELLAQLRERPGAEQLPAIFVASALLAAVDRALSEAGAATQGW